MRTAPPDTPEVESEEEEMRYIYCPECGRKLTEKEAGDDGPVPYCEGCGKYWFDSFSSCVIVMVVNGEGEIALLTQNYLSTEYKTFVSGFIKPGETAEETASVRFRRSSGSGLTGSNTAAPTGLGTGSS